jgi:serpin B
MTWESLARESARIWRCLALPWLLSLRLVAAQGGAVTGHEAAVRAVNEFGLELHRALVASGSRSNLLTSPFSVASSLAMTHAGADGATLAELSGVLHLPGRQREAQESFRHLGHALRQAVPSNGPVSLNVAQRLFGSRGTTFDPGFLNLMVMVYRSPLERLDFSKPVPSAARINAWVASETRNRIRDMMSPSALSVDTRLVLVNALHFKAPWQEPFAPKSARPEPFFVAPGKSVPVPTMSRRMHCGLKDMGGFKAVGVPYAGGRFEFVALIPDAIDGLERVELGLKSSMWVELGGLPDREVELHLPKLRMEPPPVRLGVALRALGLRGAFNEPPGSANFGRMVRAPEVAPWISEVMHQAFLELDESGTEAAAATGAVMVATSAPAPGGRPPVVRMDRPFLFVIRERETGLVLFLGRVTRP